MLALLVWRVNVRVRPVERKDEERWAELYTGDREFYGESQSDAIVANAWEWILRGKHGLLGIVAVDERDCPVALANLRWFARPDDGDVALYLDDLFTAPESRGSGAATALLEAAARIAGEGGATVVRWITDASNERARRLYDSVAVATNWVTYDMPTHPRSE